MRLTRRIRQLPRIDMTPLVNIALLLIVFFVWVKQIQRPVMLAPHFVSQGKYDYYEMASATLFLLDQNRIGFLHYGPGKATATYQEVDYSISGLRAQLARLNANGHAVVLIVPTPQSTVKNLVDVIDEFVLTKRINFVLGDELWPEAHQLIAAYHQYTKVSATK
ncbi:biopolymer transporter ExbD [Fibrivirga algicola]|uniref:Biopolymer transporter ExbD n=1 Tax=Fibrivirga algicola TaxID=2950420 RepID=A0ABX0QBE8_9BACT|nr:biopolymer transporter ExbD [Fibrivirga algicola]NID09669.1 biopolymer transporter ExbD [Fibrivirga algicola]